MKIFYLINSLEIGGAERQVIDLANLFAKDKKNTIYICTILNEVKFKDIDNNVKLITLNGSRNFSSLFKIIYKLTKLIDKIKPDVVHSHMFHSNILSRISRLSTKSKYKIINTAHSDNEGGSIRMLSYRITNFLCDHFTHVSTSAIATFEKKKASPKNYIKLIHNGIDTKKFKKNESLRLFYREKFGFKEHEKIYITIGRLVPEKDQKTQIYAFHQLKNKDNIKLVIIGDGPLRSELENLTNKLNLQETIIFTGYLSNINEVINMADFYICSSLWEGFSISIAEAMANGKIILTSDCGGPADIIQNFGYKYPIGNYNKLCSLIQLTSTIPSHEYNFISNKSVEIIEENFDFKKISKNLMHLYTHDE